MIICICLNYRSADLVIDVKKGKSVKNIISELGINKRCRKCCKFIKNEHNNIKKLSEWSYGKKVYNPAKYYTS